MSHYWDFRHRWALNFIALFSLSALAAQAWSGVQLTTEPVVTLDAPMFLTSPPRDERLFVSERVGVIRIVVDGEPLPDPFLDIHELVSPMGEGGLLGMVFHPDYDENGWFFVHYTAPRDGGNALTTVIARYSVSKNNPDRADPDSTATVLHLDAPFAFHLAGWIGFGPDDGYLYVPLGDSGQSARAQDPTDELRGKVLRLDVEGDDYPQDPARNYAIPPDNPFVGREGDDEISALGLRNPFRCTHDQRTGDLWIADVGSNLWEEVNFQAAASRGGENYGWGCMEGLDCNGNACVCNDPGLTLPVHAYPHGEEECAISAIAVYRGCTIPGLDGTYFFADLCSNRIWSFRFDGERVIELTERTEEIGGLSTIVAIGEDARGDLYIVSLQGPIVRIVAADPPKGDPCAADLDGDRRVGFSDLLILLSQWGPCEECPADIDHDGNVGFDDLLILLASWTR